MSVILGPCGYCAGVERAVGKAIAAAEKYGAVYSPHPLIHNKIAVESLRKKNILTEDKNGKLTAAIISAHGCSAKEESLLREKYTVIDATCPFVKEIHKKIEEYSANGWKIIIVGDENHVEVKGSAGRGKDSQAVNSAEEINFDTGEKFLITVQSTYPTKTYREIKKNIKNRAESLSKTVEFFDSICYTTMDRQRRAEEIAAKCDFIVVVGDKNSSNCIKLYATAKQFCEDVCFIENVTDLNSEHINKKLGMSGILSGASTPKELTMEVFNRMSEQNVIDAIVDEVKEEAVVAVTEEPAAASTEEVAKKEEKSEGEFTMAEAMKKYPTKNYREGMRLKTHVVKADMTGITVAVDGCGKNDCGFISKDEAELSGTYDAANYKEGDEIEAVIIPKEQGSKDKAINLSKKAFDAIKADDEHVVKILAGEEFTLACNQEIKGGLLGKIGTYTVFVPASQLRIGFVKSLTDYVNKPLRLKALPPKEELDEEGNVKRPRNPKRIVASQRIILEEEKAAKEDEFWSKIYEGAIVNGKVKRFTTFGAFVSLKFMDALVHNSDLSWSKKRINDPGEVLEINKNYDFIVLAADRETGKISLGYKQLQKHPFEIAQEKYPVGSVVKGKVARLVKFGAFVELEPGIDGLVHISQINHGWIQSASEALKEGDEVEVKVMNYDGEKITLSIKELLPDVPAQEENSEDFVTDKPSRTASFNRRLEGQDSRGEKKERRNRKFRDDSDDEPREYVSGSSGVTLGDLFKFDLTDKE